jgi:hypothetical protein
MKKLFLILFSLICFNAFGQFPVTSLMGSPSTFNKARGAVGADSTIIFAYAFADTTAANRGWIDAIPGSVIRTTGALFWGRNDAATAWVYIGGAGGGGGGGDNIYNIDGTLLGDRNVDLASADLNFFRGVDKSLFLSEDFNLLKDPTETVGFEYYPDSLVSSGLSPLFFQSDSMLTRTASGRVGFKDFNLLVENSKPNEWLMAASFGLPFNTGNRETVTLTSAEGYIHEMVYAEGMVFAITRDFPKKVIKFSNTNDLTDYDLLELTEDDYDGGYDIVYIPRKEKLYAAMSMEDSILIAEIDPTTFTYTVVARTAQSFHSPVGLAFDNNYLYVLTSNGVSGQGQILRFSTSAWTMTTTTLSTVGAVPHAIGYDGTDIYVSEQASPGKIYKIAPSTMTVTTSATFTAGDNNPTDDMTFAGDYVWIGLETSSGYILKILKSDLSITRVNTGSASQSYGVHFDGDFIWNLHNSTPGVVTRIDPNTTEIWKMTLATGENSPNEYVTDGQRHFFSCYLEPSKVIRMSEPTLTYVSGGAATTVTASNGLTAAANNITLGGTLTQNTTVALAGFNFGISNASTFMDFNVRPSTFSYTADNVSTPSYRNVSISASATNKFAFMQVVGGDNLSIIQVDSTTGVTLQAYQTAGLQARSEMFIKYESMNVNPRLGNLNIDTLMNLSTQNQLMGWTSTSGGDRGEVGYITIGSGLSLSGGELTASGGATPTWQQTLTAGSTLTGNNTIAGGGFDFVMTNVATFGVTGTTASNITFIADGTQPDEGVFLYAGNAGDGYAEMKLIKSRIDINPPAGLLFIDTLSTFADTTNFKPLVINTTGTAGTANRVYKATYWPGGGGASGLTVGTTTIASGTAGRVLFEGSGNVLQEDAGLFYNSTDDELLLAGISDAGAYKLQVAGSTYMTEDIRVRGANTNNVSVFIGKSTSGDFSGIWFGQTSFTTSTFSLLHNPGAELIFNAVAGEQFTFRINNGTTNQMQFTTTSNLMVGYAAGTGDPGSRVSVNGTLLAVSGATINSSGADSDTRIGGDTDANLFFTDASTDRIGIGTNAPATKLDVAGGFAAGTNTFAIGTTGKISEYANAAPTDGQILVGHTANGTFEKTTLTSTDGSITVTNGAGTIDLAIPVETADEGSYTPTLTNTTNVAASTAYTTYWYKIKNRVYVFGEVDIDATATGAVELRMSLTPDWPGSSWANTYELAGTAVCGASGVASQIRGNVAGGLASFTFVATTTTNDRYSFHFSYVVNAP